MKETQTTQPAVDADEFTLGMILGTRRAFASVAGGCSAADAECLRRMRDRKLYLSRAATWAEFCPAHLGLSKAHANRIIRNLEEFGPGYFEVAQLTRITPGQYRAIAPAIRDKTIHVKGEAIALLPENSERVTAAVAELRQVAPAVSPAPSVDERMSALGRRFNRLAKDFEEFAALLNLAQRSQLGSELAVIMMTLERLHRQMRP